MAKKNSNAGLIVIVIAFLTICGTFGRCGKSKDVPVSSAPSVYSTPLRQFADAPTPTIKSNTAIVISRHANLRDADSASATVLEVIPQDASVEVVKQQGAWYYVKTETAQGWMHGNTLKLQNFEIAPPLVQRTPKPIPEPAIEGKINSSGATAKCRDDSLSYSAHRRGTCSHHGGVAIWY